MELQRADRKKLAAQIEAVLGALDIIPFESPFDQTYATLRARLEETGQPTGGNDLLIAAQALTLDYTVVTDNQGEFGRIADLPRENWLRQPHSHRS